jgi:hypothetical protein
MKFFMNIVTKTVSTPKPLGILMTSIPKLGRENNMAKPAWKTDNMRKALDNLSNFAYGRTGSESIKADICVACGKPAVEFTDELSRREYAISGLCQECQDRIFNYDEDEE